MLMNILLLIVLFPLISSHNHLHSYPSILIDPNDYPKSDLLIHNFQQRFHPTYSYRCLLQTQSKYFYLNSSCQLLTRQSLKQVCPLNYTLKLEIVFPQNTTVYQIFIQLKHKTPLEIPIKSDQTTIDVPFDCPNQEHLKIPSKDREFYLGNALVKLLEQTIEDKQICQFEKNPYRMKLKENEIYKNFLQIKTISSCTPTNFLLASSNSKRNFDYVALDSSTGHLSLIRSLDYETITTWKLVIQANDKSNIPFYTYVIIDVEDINDCPPLLSWNFPLQTIQILNDTDSFNIEIAIEESKVEQTNVIIANLIASDLDASIDSVKFELKFNSSNSLPFEIHGPFADATFVLSTTTKLDREIQENYHLHLILTDNGQPTLSSFYRLTIHILDNNDNSPIFEQEIYHVDIQENNLINTTIVQVHANDLDAQANGRVTYEVQHPLVSIDRHTGIIRANIQFDYEQIQNFSFQVTAKDHPIKDKQLTAMTTVAVRIINQNDNPPLFPQSVYEFSIYENNAPNSYIGQVTATDADNSTLTYSLDNPSEQIATIFKVSSTDGKIYALNPLDREQMSHYTFNIIAFDGFHKSSKIQINLNILDLNDEIPQFTFPNANNDTLIIDLSFWNINDYICQIEIQDHDQIPNHSLMLIYRLDQLKNFDYLTEHQQNIQFDSNKFYLDKQAHLFFNSTNTSKLNEGVYYLAFKVMIVLKKKRKCFIFFSRLDNRW